MKGMAVPRGALAVVVCLSLGGCAIQQLNEDIAARQANVTKKTKELAALERNQAELGARRDQLLADLKRREFDAGQLRTELDQLSRLNDAASAATPEQRQQREERSRKLGAATTKAKALEQDKTLPPAEKVKRLESLKEETRNMLNLLLSG